MPQDVVAVLDSAAIMTPSADNPRGRFDRRSDSLGLWDAVLAATNKHGPIVVILAALIYFIAVGLSAKVDSIEHKLDRHGIDSNWYQRQTCISLATLAGTQTALCDPPK